MKRIILIISILIYSLQSQAQFAIITGSGSGASSNATPDTIYVDDNGATLQILNGDTIVLPRQIDFSGRGVQVIRQIPSIGFPIDTANVVNWTGTNLPSGSVTLTTPLAYPISYADVQSMGLDILAFFDDPRLYYDIEWAHEDLNTDLASNADQAKLYIRNIERVYNPSFNSTSMTSVITALDYDGNSQTPLNSPAGFSISLSFGEQLNDVTIIGNSNDTNADGVTFVNASIPDSEYVGSFSHGSNGNTNFTLNYNTFKQINFDNLSRLQVFGSTSDGRNFFTTVDIPPYNIINDANSYLKLGENGILEVNKTKLEQDLDIDHPWSSGRGHVVRNYVPSIQLPIEPVTKIEIAGANFTNIDFNLAAPLAYPITLTEAQTAAKEILRQFNNPLLYYEIHNWPNNDNDIDGSETSTPTIQILNVIKAFEGSSHFSNNGDNVHSVIQYDDVNKTIAHQRCNVQFEAYLPEQVNITNIWLYNEQNNFVQAMTNDVPDFNFLYDITENNASGWIRFHITCHYRTGINVENVSRANVLCTGVSGKNYLVNFTNSDAPINNSAAAGSNYLIRNRKDEIDFNPSKLQLDIDEGVYTFPTGSDGNGIYDGSGSIPTGGSIVDAAIADSLSLKNNGEDVMTIDNTGVSVYKALKDQNGNAPTDGQVIIGNTSGQFNWRDFVAGNNVLYVSKEYGNNATAIKGSPMFPWKDPWSARDAATAGDLVYLYRSTWTGASLWGSSGFDNPTTADVFGGGGSNSLTKDGLSYYAEAGAVIEHPSGSSSGANWVLFGAGQDNTSLAVHDLDGDGKITTNLYGNLDAVGFVIYSFAHLPLSPLSPVAAGADVIGDVNNVDGGVQAPLELNLTFNDFTLSGDRGIEISGINTNFIINAKRIIAGDAGVHEGIVHNGAYSSHAGGRHEGVRLILNVDEVVYNGSNATLPLFNLACCGVQFRDYHGAYIDINIRQGFWEDTSTGCSDSDRGTFISFTHDNVFSGATSVNIDVGTARVNLPNMTACTPESPYQTHRTTNAAIITGTDLVENSKVHVNIDNFVSTYQCIRINAGFEGVADSTGQWLFTGNYFSEEDHAIMIDNLSASSAVTSENVIFDGNFVSQNYECVTGIQVPGEEDMDITFKGRYESRTTNQSVMAIRDDINLRGAQLVNDGSVPVLESDQTINVGYCSTDFNGATSFTNITLNGDCLDQVGSGGDGSIYDNDGTLPEDRTLIGAGNNLTITGTNNTVIGASNQISLGVGFSGILVNTSEIGLSGGSIPVNATSNLDIKLDAGDNVVLEATDAIQLHGGRIEVGGETNVPRQLQFMEANTNGTNYSGFKAADDLATDQIWILPNSLGSEGEALILADNIGTLTWGIPSNPKDTIYITLQHTADNSPVLTGNGNNSFVVDPSLHNSTLISVTYRTDNAVSNSTLDTAVNIQDSAGSEVNSFTGNIAIGSRFTTINSTRTLNVGDKVRPTVSPINTGVANGLTITLVIEK